MNLSDNPLYRAVWEACRKSADFQKKDFKIAGKYDASLLFFDGSADSSSLVREVVCPLSMLNFLPGGVDLPDQVAKACFTLSAFLCEESETILEKLAYGNAVLFVGQQAVGIVLEARPKSGRSISEPTSENVTKGGKDCLTEQIKQNVSLIRRRLINPALTVDKCVVGRQSSTAIYLVFLDGICNPDCVALAKERINALDIDCVASIGVIEEALKEGGCLFPQVVCTERPDRVCAYLNEGCVAVLIDGFPFVLLAPVTILHHLSTADDYARHPVTASVIRILRYFLLLVALILPGFYISVAVFHQEMLPSKLANSIIRTRLSVPFNDLIEILVLLVAFEILVEAGLRMPRNIGQTVSIVGGLIVGDAAVNAQIISPVVVIVVAIAVIATYTIPDQDFSNAVRLCRFLICLVCSVLGLAGLSFSMIALNCYLCASRSLGVPYMAPLTGTSPPTKDTFCRLAFREDVKRPAYLGTKNKVRRKEP